MRSATVFRSRSGSSLIATALATMVAIVIARYQFRGKGVLLGMSMLPLIVPYLVLGVALSCSSRRWVSNAR